MKKKEKTPAEQQPTVKAAIGRPPNPEPTPAQRSQVETLAGFGLTQEEIATALDMGEVQLRRDFPAELKKGGIKADIAVTQNLFKIATGTTPQAVSAAIFWKKVRSRWHEVQRIIHGFDPEIVSGFVKQVVIVLRKELPDSCPHCQTKLDLPKRIASQLKELSAELMGRLPPSEIVPIPIAEDGEKAG